MQNKSKSTKSNIFIVEDHPIMRQGLAQLINSDPELTTCGEAESTQEALVGIKVLQPHLVIIDISLKNSNGLDLAKAIDSIYPSIKILVLSMYDEALYAERSLRAGAKGYITKQAASENILLAVHCILSGNVYFSEETASSLLTKYAGKERDSSQTEFKLLSNRELEVFRLIGQGFSTRQISNQMHLKIKTIETYRAHIKGKLKLGSAVQLVHKAISWSQKKEVTPS